VSNVIPAFHILAKPVGPICNLDCEYCFYLEKEDLYAEDNKFRMSSEVLESFIRQKIEAHKVDVVSFTWQGGEPTLLGLEYFEEVVKLQNKYADGKQIQNGFQTNGVLLNDEWAKFFVNNNFLVGISIDGPEHIHDHYRKNRSGGGSFKKVMAGLDILKKHKVEFNTLTVVQAGNVDHADEIYDFLKLIGSTFWQFIPVVERHKPDGTLAPPEDLTIYPMAEWSVDPDKFGHFLDRIFQRWVREDVGKIFVQTFESALANHLGMNPGVCVWNETCGTALAIEHDGDLYPCDHYVFPEYKLGNINELPMVDLVHAPEQRKFGQDKESNLPQVCRDCEVLDLCHGECPKHRFVVGENGEKYLNYLCPSYLHFFKSIRPELGVLAELLEMKQPAEGIIQWMEQKDAGFPDLKVSRNDPCPCGSGKKFKLCCASNSN
jgi:uncharacterized protein